MAHKRRKSSLILLVLWLSVPLLLMIILFSLRVVVLFVWFLVLLSSTLVAVVCRCVLWYIGCGLRLRLIPFFLFLLIRTLMFVETG